MINHPADYLAGKILTGNRQEVADTLASIRTPHAHEGVPGGDTGNRDVTFRDWLNSYVTAHISVMERQPRHLTRLAKRLLDEQNNQNADLRGLY